MLKKDDYDIKSSPVYCLADNEWMEVYDRGVHTAHVKLSKFWSKFVKIQPGRNMMLDEQGLMV
jgi:hypothetical protein